MINFCLDNYICMLKWNLFQVMQKPVFPLRFGGTSAPTRLPDAVGQGIGYGETLGVQL
jgi:hypothetical protein